MGKPFLSRHFLGEDPTCIAAVPFAAAGAAEAGVATTHNLLALGTWSEDAQVGGSAMRVSHDRRPPSTAAAARRRRPPPLTAATCGAHPQESRLTIVDLAVGHTDDEIASHPAMKRLASFTHSGRVAALEVRRRLGAATAHARKAS